MIEPPLTLKPLQVDVCQVLDGQGLHLGNLKLIGAVWKFKAIGYGPAGELIPGGGPLTARHNTRLDSLDADRVSAGLLSD
jgi:hypothetical protein